MDLKEFLKMVKEEWIVLILENGMVQMKREEIIKHCRFESLEIKSVSVDQDPDASGEYVLFLEVSR